MSVPKLYLLASLNVEPRYLDMARLFLRHYDKLGVDKFFLILRGDEESINHFKQFLSYINHLALPWTTSYHSCIRNKYVDVLREEINRECDVNDWLFTVDGDEFFVFPSCKTWKDFYPQLRKHKSQYVISFLLDMIHKDLNWKHTVDESENILEDFCIPTSFSQDIMKVEIQKIPLSLVGIERTRNSNHTIVEDKQHIYRPYPEIIPMRHIRITKTGIEDIKIKCDMYKQDIQTKKKSNLYGKGYKFFRDNKDISKIVLSTNQKITAVSYGTTVVQENKKGRKLKLFHKNGIYGKKAQFREFDLITPIQLDKIGL